MDVPAASQTNGTQPTLWDCNGGSNQTWTSTATNQLTVYDTKCLDLIGGATADGTGVQIYDCNGSCRPAVAGPVRRQRRQRRLGQVPGRHRCGTANSIAAGDLDLRRRRQPVLGARVTTTAEP